MGSESSSDDRGLKSIYTQTQSLDLTDSPSSGDELKDGGMQFDDTLPIDDDLCETEVVGERNDIDAETQILEDTDCIANLKEKIADSDCEGAGGTEVLLSDGEDEVFDDAATPCKVKESIAQRRIEDGELGLENKKSMISYNQETKDVLLDFDALTDDGCSSGQGFSSAAPLNQDSAGSNPGSVQRNFASVRAASLRSSGIAAALSMTPRRTDIKLHPTANSGEAGPGQMQDIVEPLDPSSDGIRMDSCSDPTTCVGTEARKVDQNKKVEKLQKSTKDIAGDGTRRLMKKTRARKLFNEGICYGDEELIGKADSPTQKVDSLQLFVNDDAIAGLSYAGSQEPGEQSQAHAWNVVDKLLSINDVELSGEVDPGEATRMESPPVSSVKGAQVVAERTDFRSPLEKTRIYDWVDSQEDEGGGDLFCKRKDALFGGRENMQKSHTHPWKPKHVTVKRTGSAVDGFTEKEENRNTQIHQKIMGLTQSDSRIMVNNSIRTGVQTFETLTKRNLFKEMGEELNAELLGQRLERAATGAGPQSIYDVGIDTQLAAEAMEALVCGPPANHELADAHLEERNMIECSNGAEKRDARSRHASVTKRGCSSSDYEGNTRPSKRTKKLRGKIGRRNSNSSRKQLSSKTKMKSTKSANEQLSMGKSFNADVCSNDKVLGIIKKGKIGEEMDGSHIVGREKHHKPLKSNWQVSFGKELMQREHLHGTGPPVARHTRQSVKRNSLKMPEVLSNNDPPIEFSIIGRNERGCDSVIDASGHVTVRSKCLISSPDQSGILRKTKARIPKTQVTEGLLEDNLNANHVKNGLCSYPRGRRTRRRMSHDIKTASEACKPAEGDQTNTPIVSNLCVMDEKMPSKEHTTPKPGTLSHSRLKYSAYFSLVHDAKGNGTLEGSSKGPIKPSSTACSTPSKELNAVSPTKDDDGHTKQSVEKRLSRSSLIRELIRLDAPDAVQTPAWKDMRRRRDMASVCVLFSHHLGEDIIRQQKKILARLGASIVSSASDATHFIADKFARTRNMLETIALGKPVVTHLWLESCGQASCFIDEKNYILRDTKKEKEIGFSMPTSLARACSSPLLKGKRVFITPNVKPDKELITNLVKASHGQVVERIGRAAMKDDKVPSDLLVISCEEDYAVCAPLLEKGAGAYSSELLLNGIVIQKLQYERYCLFADHVKRTRPTIWLRNEADNQFHPVTKCK